MAICKAGTNAELYVYVVQCLIQAVYSDSILSIEFVILILIRYFEKT